jgi:hypothetical protein
MEFNMPNYWASYKWETLINNQGFNKKLNLIDTVFIKFNKNE